MNSFNGNRKLEIIPIVLSIITINIIGVLVINLLNSYLMLNLIIMILVICNIFYLYHIGVWVTVKYEITEKEIVINALWGFKKVVLPISDLECYTLTEGKIKGISLSGLSSNKFSIGRIVLKSLGTTRMFVTCSDRVIYLKTAEMNYGISPKDSKTFEDSLKKVGIVEASWTKQYNRAHKLHKDKVFAIPLYITSIIILVMTFTPMTMYVLNKLPNVMPLVLSETGKILEVGTDKQFAFNQMTYGILNMAVLFCMYFAAHFCAKYDKKAAFRYIYISLLIALLFLSLQFRLLTISMLR